MERKVEKIVHTKPNGIEIKVKIIRKIIWISPDRKKSGDYKDARVEAIMGTKIACARYL